MPNHGIIALVGATLAVAPNDSDFPNDANSPDDVDSRNDADSYNDAVAPNNADIRATARVAPTVAPTVVWILINRKMKQWVNCGHAIITNTLFEMNNPI